MFGTSLLQDFLTSCCRITTRHPPFLRSSRRGLWPAVNLRNFPREPVNMKKTLKNLARLSPEGVQGTCPGVG